MPAVAPVVREEAPGESVVLILHEDANARRLAWLVAHVLFPDHRQEEGASRVHNGDVWQKPAPVIRLQRLDDTEEERMLWHGTHRIVGDTRRSGPTNPGGIREEGIKAAVAALSSGVRSRLFFFFFPSREQGHHGCLHTSSRSMYVPP